MWCRQICRYMHFLGACWLLGGQDASVGVASFWLVLNSHRSWAIAVPFTDFQFVWFNLVRFAAVLLPRPTCTLVYMGLGQLIQTHYASYSCRLSDWAHLVMNSIALGYPGLVGRPAHSNLFVRNSHFPTTPLQFLLRYNWAWPIRRGPLGLTRKKASCAVLSRPAPNWPKTV